MTELSPEQIRAAQKWERDTENARRTDNALRRLVAADSMRIARSALTPREIAILDMALVKHRRLAELAKASGVPAAHLKELLTQTLSKLAQHYEGRTG